MNNDLLEALAKYLNGDNKIIQSQIKKVMKSGVTQERALSLLLCEYTGYKYNYEEIITRLDEKQYLNDPYYKNIRLESLKYNSWTFKYNSYKPFELFVFDDFKDELPQIGYFDKPFKYPEILQNNRQWMSITPNEINTMKKAIANAFGNVLVIGVGMLYYPYMISFKDNVDKITVIDIDENIINLNLNKILPQFEKKDKIRLIKSDAFTYLDNLEEKYDYIFIDIWHDVSDGFPLYKKFKQYEKKYFNIKFDYWIEDTIKFYL